MAKRSFTAVRDSMTLSKFNLFCKSIAIEYAYSPLVQARTYFTETYNITPGCYQQIKDYAVKHYLVSEETVDRMEDKSKMNMRRNSSSNGHSSKEHYATLRAARKQFIHDLAQEYVDHPEMSLTELVQKHGRSLKGYFYMLYVAFTSSQYRVPFALASKMIARMYTDCPSEDKALMLCTAVEILWEERNTHREETQ